MPSSTTSSPRSTRPSCRSCAWDQRVGRPPLCAPPSRHVPPHSSARPCRRFRPHRHQSRQTTGLKAHSVGEPKLLESSPANGRPMIHAPAQGAPRGDSARPARAARPVLLLLVFASFLVIVGATASGQVALVTADSSASLRNATVGADAVIVRSFVSQNLRQGDVLASRAAERQLAFTGRPSSLGRPRRHPARGTPRARGTVLATDDGMAVGTAAPMNEGLLAAVEHRAADAAVVRSEVAGSLTPL